MKKPKRLLSIFLVLCMLFSVFTGGIRNVSASEAEDSRAYMHGVNLLQVEDKTLLIFSSNGYPPTLPGDEWDHDIYYSWLDPKNIDYENPENSLDIETLVDDILAQEPASAAINSNGAILVSAEDAQHAEALDQTFGIWNSSLRNITPYGEKLMPPQGGHSGHVAASGDKFLVTFCDGWINGGGVDNLGTGDDIYSRVVYEDGTMGPLMETSVGAANRDWWSVVAGSDSNWLQVWQRYGIAGEGGGTVYAAITTEAGAGEPIALIDNNRYYYYDVCYVPTLERYLVTGSTLDEGGFAVLVDKTGKITARETGLPYTVREARTLVKQVGNTHIAVYPTLYSGAAVLNLTANSVNLNKTLNGTIKWDYIGTDGMFLTSASALADTEVLFVAGTKEGIKFEKFDLGDPAGADDLYTGGDSEPVDPNDFSYLDNIALNKTATATTYYDEGISDEYAPDKALDGDKGTRWDSIEGSEEDPMYDTVDPQEFTIDLGDVYIIKKIAIDWDAPALEYSIKFSNEDSEVAWDAAEPVFSTTEGISDWYDVISAEGSARYVKFIGIKRDTPWGYSFTEFEIYGYKPFETKISTWLDNKEAAYTVGFAGGFKKSLTLIEPLMEEYGIKGTAYINTANMGSTEMATWAELTALTTSDALSLGYFGPGFDSQFVDRDGNWNDGMSAAAADALMAAGKSDIETNTGLPAEVMMGNDYLTGKNPELTDVMEDYFLATMRGDFEAAVNRLGTDSYYDLGGHVVYPFVGWGNSNDDMNAAVDAAIASNGFVSIESRGVYDDVEEYKDLTVDDYLEGTGAFSDYPDWWMPTPYSWLKNHFEYVENKNDQLWIESLAKIVKYIREREAASVLVKSFDDDGGIISLMLPEDMAQQKDCTGKARFGQALTLQTAVPNEWTSVTVKQGDGEVSAPITPYIKDGKKWISYNAVPGKDNIITAASTGSYDALGRVKAMVQDSTVQIANDHKRAEDGDTFKIKLLNATLRETIPENGIEIIGLPEGMTAGYSVDKTDNSILITISGASCSPITRVVTIYATIKGKSVNELEALNSGALKLKLVGSLSVTGESEVSSWKGNKASAYTATYDDGIINSLKKFETLHKKYDFPANMALVPTYIEKGEHEDNDYYGGVSMGSWQDFKDLVATGYFEVSSHMMNHAKPVDGKDLDGGDYDGHGIPDFLDKLGADALRDDFRASREKLEEMLGVPCETIIYPNYDTNDEINNIAKEVFIAARTGGDEYDGNKPNGENYYELYSKTFYDKEHSGDEDTTVEEAKAWLNTVIEKGLWLITVGHGCDYEGWGSPPLEVYDGFYDYVADHKDEVWIDTLSNISKYMMERNSSTLTSSMAGNVIRVGLIDTLDNEVYDQKLTVKTKIPDEWTNVYVLQNGKRFEASLYSDSSGKYVLYDVLPDEGTITITNSYSNNGEDNSSGNDTGSSGTSSPSNNTLITVPSLNTATGVASASLIKSNVEKAFKSSKTVAIEVPKVENATSYNITLPSGILDNSNANGRLSLQTNIAGIELPLNLLDSMDLKGNEDITLSIGVSKRELSEEQRGLVGNRPVISLNMEIEGKVVEWNNPDYPVTVTIPYTLTEEDMQNPEGLVVWFIGSSGELQPMTNTKYDATTGTITFTTTHFSTFAVALPDIAFTDMGRHAWAEQAAKVLVAKGIIESGGSTFRPDAKATRAEFIAYLVRSLGLTATVNSNFSDVAKDDPYYREIGVAKALGITSGTGNNQFSPDKEMMRQDMMVLVDRALRVAGIGLKDAGDDVLKGFSDNEAIAPFARNSVTKLVAKGIIKGSGNAINPNHAANRAEAAAIIYRLIK